MVLVDKVGISRATRGFTGRPRMGRDWLRAGNRRTIIQNQGISLRGHPVPLGKSRQENQEMVDSGSRKTSHRRVTEFRTEQVVVIRLAAERCA